jgi:hypothetical protein
MSGLGQYVLEIEHKVNSIQFIEDWSNEYTYKDLCNKVCTYLNIKDSFDVGIVQDYLYRMVELSDRRDYHE